MILTYEDYFKDNTEEERSFLNALRVITSPGTNYAWTNSIETYLNTYVVRFYLLILNNKEVVVTYSSIKLMRKIPILNGFSRQAIIEGLERIGFQKREIKLADNIKEIAWCRQLTDKEIERVVPGIKVTEMSSSAIKQIETANKVIEKLLQQRLEKYGKIDDKYIEGLSRYIAEQGLAKNFIEAEGMVKRVIIQLNDTN